MGHLHQATSNKALERLRILKAFLRSRGKSDGKRQRETSRSVALSVDKGTQRELVIGDPFVGRSGEQGLHDLDSEVVNINKASKIPAFEDAGLSTGSLSILDIIHNTLLEDYHMGICHESVRAQSESVLGHSADMLHLLVVGFCAACAQHVITEELARVDQIISLARSLKAPGRSVIEKKYAHPPHIAANKPEIDSSHTGDWVEHDFSSYKAPGYFKLTLGQIEIRHTALPVFTIYIRTTEWQPLFLTTILNGEPLFVDQSSQQTLHDVYSETFNKASEDAAPSDSSGLPIRIEVYPSIFRFCGLSAYVHQVKRLAGMTTNKPESDSLLDTGDCLEVFLSSCKITRYFKLTLEQVKQLCYYVGTIFGFESVGISEAVQQVILCVCGLRECSHILATQGKTTLEFIIYSHVYNNPEHSKEEVLLQLLSEVLSSICGEKIVVVARGCCEDDVEGWIRTMNQSNDHDTSSLSDDDLLIQNANLENNVLVQNSFVDKEESVLSSRKDYLDSEQVLERLQNLIKDDIKSPGIEAYDIEYLDSLEQARKLQGTDKQPTRIRKIPTSQPARPLRTRAADTFDQNDVIKRNVMGSHHMELSGQDSDSFKDDRDPTAKLLEIARATIPDGAKLEEFLFLDNIGEKLDVDVKCEHGPAESFTPKVSNGR